MKLNNLVIIGVAATTVASCAPSKKEYASYELYPVRTGSLAEMEYAPACLLYTSICQNGISIGWNGIPTV